MASERYFEILLSRSVNYVLGDEYCLIAHQLTLPSGRIDLLLKHTNGVKHVVEVKKDTAKPDAVDQVLRYVSDFRSLGDGQVIGWVVANGITPETETYADTQGMRTLAIPTNEYPAIMAASNVLEDDLLGNRVQAGILIGGGVQTFRKNSVPFETAITDLSEKVRIYVLKLHNDGEFEFSCGKMQIAIIYKGVKIGGINRGHRHNFISSNIILDAADELALIENGFTKNTKTQASSAHVHVYWKNRIDDIEALQNVLRHFSAVNRQAIIFEIVLVVVGLVAKLAGHSNLKEQTIYAR